MKILSVLTYYRPHTSGLTIYVERLAKALVKRGHEVTILTSQFDPSLSSEEIQDGVRIIRAPVLFRVSKGVIMPTFGYLAWKLAMETDVIHLHLPQFDAAGVAFRGRLLRKPTVISYHCDLLLPEGIFNRFVNLVVHFMNNLTGFFSHNIGAYTEDFASHSPFLKRFSSKVRVILPPVELPVVDEKAVADFKLEHNPERKYPVIGMATRFAAEKGVEILLNALPDVLEKYPDALVLYAGQYLDVMNEDTYLDRLMPAIKGFQESGNWKFLGVLNPEQMAMFYPNIDVLLVPSLNSTETFGLVQIEAMMNRTPSIASNLPGVRQPVTMTGMGEVVPIGDSEALAKAMLRIFSSPEKYQGDPEQVCQQFDPQTNAEAYENLYLEIMERFSGT